ncbi:hypothetical protein [Streptococcus parauberis]|uniref:hypothetical protein n=1 Tax=Streptococcus parauberis TaxID=1348 RepID=UPI000E307235|nr:hypothetical protein [Streptococcus parauberis]RFE01175.1 hypothetical protein ADO06_02050 [Streptococcus parauberis]
MKIKPLILLLASFLLVACSNGNQETAEKSFGEKAKTTQTSKKSSSASKDSSKSKTQTKKSNEELYAESIVDFQKEFSTRTYTFYDINNDGNDEMIVGGQSTPLAVYFLNNGVETRLVYNRVGSGIEKSKYFKIYKNGKIYNVIWDNSENIGNIEIYNLNGTPPFKIEKKYNEISKTELDTIFSKVESSELDLTKLEWSTIANSTDPKNTETSSSIESFPNNENIAEYTTDVFPSAWKPGTKYRDGFYITLIENTKEANARISQITNMRDTDTISVTSEDSYEFLHWIREIAPDGTTKNGLKSNYDYWVKNVK